MLKDKVVWITGAGSGIGKATAILFGQHNALIALSGRSARRLQSVSDNIVKTGGKAHPFPCDITKGSDVSDTFLKIKSMYGKIDILINNAGAAIFKSIADTTEAEWNRLININLTGAFLTTKAVIPYMTKKRCGHIVNIISVAGIKPFSSCSAYCSSKYGLMGLTSVTREEVRAYNIKVTAVIPGATDTPLWDKAEGNFDKTKMIDPKDVAKTVYYACSQYDSAMIEELVLRPVAGDM